MPRERLNDAVDRARYGDGPGLFAAGAVVAVMAVSVLAPLVFWWMAP